MKNLITLIILFLFVCSVSADRVDDETKGKALNIDHRSILSKTKWIHGSAKCDTNTDPTLDIYKHDNQSYIIRQNKCLTFEAPFIYVLIGTDRILVLDTGAIESLDGFSMYQSIVSMIGEDSLANKDMLVLHTHSHSDHYKGDADFIGQPDVTLIQPTAKSVQHYFKFADWPEGTAEVDLGGRVVTIIPTPGHQEEAIAIYDPKTKWLLTGDTLYPGYIYVKDWAAYQSSIARLASFASQNEISAILGAHIEMKNEPAQYYPVGSTYQPNEASIDMSVQKLYSLNNALININPKRLEFDYFVIEPMNVVQKTISNIGRWLTQ